ncbi:MAG: Glycine/D-amino acid oxidases (deaminating) [uncultured Rubrobacteraceae bacterium]|uniref:Glycine/D-amino acid oxidases (Deaminating) n=1 Tax=uncultured Rubrobacteraceae bacterium TaxID=349277 RepID=A0A6J4PRZ9_9ACTN|nr:MAG: Glycine/D-amino acid oxidases (deaminating) [uncultured Rubrobacteraceae bacterium]
MTRTVGPRRGVGPEGKDYRAYSFWLETAGEELVPRAPLRGPTEADVAVLGAGFTGLWAAYYLLRREPSLRVVVLEAETAGFGASGRNGAWCNSAFPVSPKELARRFGGEAARDLLLEMRGAVDEVGRVSEAEGIDAQYFRGGQLRVARGPAQVPGVEASYESLRGLGLGEGLRLLDAQETARRVRITGAEGALYSPHCATIHPARLARGLARAVERMGGEIFEGTPVTDFETGSEPRLVTGAGDVRARTVVLAGEAYLARLRRLRRQVLPIYSLIVLTEPLSGESWAGIGWEGRECVASNRYTVDYLSRTADGRILFGGRGAPYHYGSRVEDEYDLHEPTHEMLRRTAREWFPALEGARFTHAWGGPLAMPRDWMPTMSYDPVEGVATARGYTGQGVATANLSGRTLADLILGRDTHVTRLPTVNHKPRPWEPEPLRWLGARYVQRGLMRVDDRAERTGKPPTGKTLAERLGRH